LEKQENKVHQIDVIIATYNSEKRIANTLESLKVVAKNLEKIDVEWKLYIIDNNSNDKTSQVIEDNKGDLPLILSYCSIQGKSAALNSCLPSLKAELRVFTDDDITFQEDWLAQIWKCAKENPEFDIFTGNIIGNWEAEMDAKLKTWIPMGSTYALREEDVSGKCDSGEVWGPNMSIRKSAFDKTGLKFNEDVGPSSGAIYPMGDETNMVHRLSKAGCKCYFDHLSVVHHLIKKETINDDWVIRRAERLGYGLLANGADGYGKRKYRNISLHNEIRLIFLFWAMVYPITFIMPRCKHSFWGKWGYFHFRGLLKGYKRFMK